MPTNQALQVFYGTIPLLLVLVGYYTRENMLLKDILKRLGSVETEVKAIRSELVKIERRLTTLETRVGIIYHEN
jgi:hypothetical protein